MDALIHPNQFSYDTEAKGSMYTMLMTPRLRYPSGKGVTKGTDGIPWIPLATVGYIISTVPVVNLYLLLSCHIWA